MNSCNCFRKIGKFPLLTFINKKVFKLGACIIIKLPQGPDAGKSVGLIVD
jgi:hypothetical protein